MKRSLTEAESAIAGAVDGLARVMARHGWTLTYIVSEVPKDYAVDECNTLMFTTREGIVSLAKQFECGCVFMGGAYGKRCSVHAARKRASR